MDYIYKQGDGQKIYVFNASAVSFVWWIALDANQDFYAERVEKIIHAGAVGPGVSGAELLQIDGLLSDDFAEIQGLGIFYVGGRPQPIMQYLCSTSFRPFYEKICRVFEITGRLVPYGTLTGVHVLQSSETGKAMRFIPLNEWLSGVREGQELDLTKLDKIPMEFFVHKRTTVMDYDTVLAMADQIPAPVKLTIFDNDVPQSVLDNTRFGNFPFHVWV